MLGSHEDFYSEETPGPGADPLHLRLMKLAGLLAPEQRLLLSVFLFLDVCVICFGCLLLTGKIGLPF